jgi:hypothetical protein
VTYQKHDVSNGPFNMQSLNALDSERTALRTESWELDVSAIRFHDLANFVQSVEKNAVNLGG